MSPESDRKMQRYRLLLISPHPDDEAIFFGGTLARYAQAGVNIRVLHLTTGCSDFTRISYPERSEILQQRELSQAEQLQTIEMRKQEAERSAQILGLCSVECLPFASRSLDISARDIIRQQIEAFDPHVILSLSEAGTTAHRDHSWSAALTYQAIRAMIEEKWSKFVLNRTSISHPPFAFRRYFTYTLPGCEQWLEKWSEMTLSAAEMTCIDVSEFLKCKRAAARAYRTQQHLIVFFDSVELLQLSRECYYERISLGRSARGTDDLFGAWEEAPVNICYGPLPEEHMRYRFSASAWSEQFWNVVQHSSERTQNQ